MDGMTQSRSVLIVLSQSYLDSYKCRFELDQAFEERRFGKRVFAIKLRDIPSSSLQRHAKALELLQSERFVEWPINCSGTKRARRNLVRKKHKFWNKLSDELYKGMDQSSNEELA